MNVAVIIKWWQKPEVADRIGERSVELLNEIELRRAELAGICVRVGHVLGPEQSRLEEDMPPFPPHKVYYKYCLRCGVRRDSI